MATWSAAMSALAALAVAGMANSTATIVPARASTLAPPEGTYRAFPPSRFELGGALHGG